MQKYGDPPSEIVEDINSSIKEDIDAQPEESGDAAAAAAGSECAFLSPSALLLCIFGEYVNMVTTHNLKRVVMRRVAGSGC